MDIEKCERLLSDLEEAKGSFDIIIENMKEEGIDYPYEDLIKLVDDSCYRIKNAINKLSEDSFEYSVIANKNAKYLRLLKINKYCRVLTIFISLFIFNAIKNKISSPVVGNVFALIGIAASIISADVISENMESKIKESNARSSEECRSLLTLEDDYKKSYLTASNDIDTIQSINRNLWNELAKPKTLDLERKPVL